ncbi:MAG: class I SAM-dependent methyltransferase [Chitinophagaceae bacterium]|nr:MAG: class I SAM-dependent methyltransferase [Chitinophagaceae bacterium]
MYSSVALAKKYLHYYWTAFNGKGHGMHSPFVFGFILHVLNNKSGYTAPPEVEQLRKQLLTDVRVLDIEDLGAGSRVATTKQRSVQQLAKSALKTPKYAQLLYRLVKYYEPKTILELGTSLGVTTSYLSLANSSAAITTIEGSKAVAGVAKENFSGLGLQNIQLLQGNFDALLPSVIPQLPSIDLAYIDGNHRYEPTMRYFRQLLPALHNNSILVFDDIHWSKEMEQAWEEIKQHPSVQCTIDIFFLGFVFFRREFKVKQHFKIRY